MVRIKSIHPRACRGIIDTPFDIEEKSLVLLGENGSGKSSLVDAIEFFFTGNISHLHGQDLSLREHGPHVAMRERDFRVALTFNPGTVTLMRTLAEEPEPPETLALYVEEASQSRFLLRRADLLKFIISQPANRYEAIAGLIGIESLEKTEVALLHIRDHFSEQLAFAKSGIQEKYEELSRTVGTTITKANDILPALNGKLVASGLPKLLSFSIAESYQQNLLKQVRSGSEPLTQAISKLKGALEGFQVPESLSENLKALLTIARALLKQREQLTEIALADLLRSGLSVLSKFDTDVCPLCNRPIDQQELESMIKDRLAKIQGLSSEANKLKPLYSKIKTTMDSLRQSVENLELQAGKLKLIAPGSVMPKVTESAAYILKEAEAAAQLEREPKLILLQNLKAHLDNFVKMLYEKVNAALSGSSLSDKEKSILENLNLVEYLRKLTAQIAEGEKQIPKLTEICKQAEIAYETFSKTKKKQIATVYHEIQSDCTRFYTTLHPGENTSNISLEVVEGRRASAKVKIDFYNNEGVDPRSFGSEGHLDSLGLCIFLAFVKRFNKECNLIILDDVIMSVDSGHRGRICQILFEEFADYQLIITTHDNLWFEELQNYQRAYKFDGRFQNLRITGWTLESGPTIEPYKPRWERIMDRIKRSDFSAANEGRQYLEWLLARLCQNCQAQVTFKEGSRYETRDLIGPAEKKLKKLAPTMAGDIEKLFARVKANAIFGNILSHNNPLAEITSIKEVEDFCSAVKALHDFFMCRSCMKMVKLVDDLETLRCPSGKCKNPLVMK